MEKLSAENYYRYMLRVFGKWAWGGSSTLSGLTIWSRPHVVSFELAQSDLLSHWGLLGLTFWAAESRKRGRFFLHKVMQPWSPECLESQHPTYASSKKLLNYAPNCLCANCAKSQRSQATPMDHEINEDDVQTRAITANKNKNAYRFLESNPHS